MLRVSTIIKFLLFNKQATRQIANSPVAIWPGHFVPDIALDQVNLEDNDDFVEKFSFFGTRMLNKEDVSSERRALYNKMIDIGKTGESKTSPNDLE